MIGLVLVAGGALISLGSLLRAWASPASRWRLRDLAAGASLVAKMGLAAMKFRYGRKLQSAALTADAWNDAMDTLSAVAALIAVGLTLTDPVRFAEADRYGGFVVGLIVISAGRRVSHETAMQLMDTMPDEPLMAQIRAAADERPGAAASRSVSRAKPA